MVKSSPRRAPSAQARPGNAPGRLAFWSTSHARCLLESLGRLKRRWLASLLTCVVIGIAMALPAGLYILVKNLDTLAATWHQSVQISVYLKPNVSSQEGRALTRRLATEQNVADTRFISAAQGLAQFRKASGFGAALDALGDNPLPGVIQVTPTSGLTADAAGRLVDRLSRMPHVDHAALDQAWLRRLNAILGLISRAAVVIAVLLAAAVVFIVGNTIRLDIENRRQEIEVMKLLGATNAFIRRPFLYTGVWYGLFGALIALILLGACDLALAGPLAALIASYHGALNLRGLNAANLAELIGIGIALGWIGCAITVNRRLAAIEPR